MEVRCRRRWLGGISHPDVDSSRAVLAESTAAMRLHRLGTWHKRNFIPHARALRSQVL